MSDVKELQQKRNKIFSDMYNNIIPERMPVSFGLHSLIMAEYAKLDILDVHYDYSRVGPYAEEVVQLVYSDTCPYGPVSIASRIPAAYQLIDSQSFRLGTNNYMQHPEVVGMEPEEYPALIDDPYACILEKVLPRQHKALALDDPITRANRINMLKAENNRQLINTLAIARGLTEKFGYYQGAPAGSGGFTAAPYDFIADQLRSFSGISTDIRRRKSELLAACEALTPLMFSLGLPSNPAAEGMVGMPLHMPTFMREKDFIEVWLPSYLNIIQQYAARGIRTRPFCEDDWTRYADILYDFPAGTVMAFEYGDPQILKDKLGKKHIIAGLFPISLLKHGTKQQVIDKAKELLDIMLPGGGYLFGLDKGPLMLSDLNLENCTALTEFVRDNASYSNAGESYGVPVNSENYTADPDFGKFESKYLTSWNEFKEKYPMTPEFMEEIIRGYDMENLRFFLGLLV